MQQEHMLDVAEQGMGTTREKEACQVMLVEFHRHAF